MSKELPELTLEEVKEKMLECFNKGEYDKGVGIWLYYKLGQKEFIEKTSEAIIEGIKQVRDLAPSSTKEVER